MPKLLINESEIYYELTGQGEEVLVFLNGVAMSTDSWIYQMKFFSRSYQVLVHDFRGQGKSQLSSANLTFDLHAADLKALLDSLGLAKIHVIGVSYGAEVGMYFTLNYPKYVKTLTLGTAASESEPLLKGMIESWIQAAQTYNGKLFFKVMAPLVYSNTFYLTCKEWLDHRAQIFDKTVTREWFDAFIELCQNFLTLNVTERLKEIQTPTLIVAGAEDILKPPAYSVRIHNEIKNSVLAIIKEAGHGLFLEKPDEFNQVITEFIEKHR